MGVVNALVAYRAKDSEATQTLCTPSLVLGLLHAFRPVNRMCARSSPLLTECFFKALVLCLLRSLSAIVEYRDLCVLTNDLLGAKCIEIFMYRVVVFFEAC